MKKKTPKKTKLASDTKKALAAIPLNKQQYVLAKEVGGESKFDAAVDSGYSPSTARVAGSHIEDEDTLKAMALVRRDVTNAVVSLIDPDKIARVIDEGLDAERTITNTVKTESWTKRGKVSKQDVVITKVPDHLIRLQAVDRYQKMVGVGGVGGAGVDINNYGPAQIILDL